MDTPNNKQTIPGFDPNKFIAHIESEMEWNLNGKPMRMVDKDAKRDPKNPSVMTDHEVVEWDTNLKPTDYAYAFRYFCLVGSSVSPELRKAIKEYDPKLKVRIVRDGDTSARAFYHEYIIIIDTLKK